jgi:transposase
MRGNKTAQTNFICLLNVEERIPAGHPIREVKRLIEEVFNGLGACFEEMYAQVGRPSIPPERLLAAKVLMALYSVRSERMFCERLRYDLLFQWFLDLNPDQVTFEASTFSKNQERLLKHHAADLFFASVVELAREQGWASNEHFSVDGTLIEAWASLKSFRPTGEVQGPGDGNTWADFKGEKRSNQTHESTTDAEAKLARKGPGREARLCFGMGAVMENRNGLCMHLQVTPASGQSEAQTAMAQIDELSERGMKAGSVGGDKHFHQKQFVGGCRARGIVPHVALIKGRKVQGVDARTTRTKSYQVSQVIRRRIEEIFGWMKTAGGLRKSRYRGVSRTHQCAQFVGAALNLLRMAKLSLLGAQV